MDDDEISFTLLDDDGTLVDAAISDLMRCFCLTLVEDDGRRYAFDIDPAKTGMLRSMISQPMFVMYRIVGQTNLEVCHEDFVYGRADFERDEDGYTPFVDSFLEHVRERVHRRHLRRIGRQP
jgi:hypothetical protein